MEIERRPETVKLLTRTLLERAPANAIPGGHQALENSIVELINAWRNVSKEFEDEGLSYSEDCRLLNYPLDPKVLNLHPDHQRFVAARSMRDVEPSVVLKLRDPYGQNVQS